MRSDIGPQPAASTVCDCCVGLVCSVASCAPSAAYMVINSSSIEQCRLLISCRSQEDHALARMQREQRKERLAADHRRSRVLLTCLVVWRTAVEQSQAMLARVQGRRIKSSKKATFLGWLELVAQQAFFQARLDRSADLRHCQQAFKVHTQPCMISFFCARIWLTTNCGDCALNMCCCGPCGQCPTSSPADMHCAGLAHILVPPADKAKIGSCSFTVLAAKHSCICFPCVVISVSRSIEA